MVEWQMWQFIYRCPDKGIGHLPHRHFLPELTQRQISDRHDSCDFHFGSIFQPLHILFILGTGRRAETAELFQGYTFQTCRFVQDTISGRIQIFTLINQASRQFVVFLVTTGNLSFDEQHAQFIFVCPKQYAIDRNVRIKHFMLIFLCFHNIPIKILRKYKVKTTYDIM